MTDTELMALSDKPIVQYTTADATSPNTRAAPGREGGDVDIKRFQKAPCYLCGYNGGGYYQPERHVCADRYHKAVALSCALDGMDGQMLRRAVSSLIAERDALRTAVEEMKAECRGWSDDWVRHAANYERLEAERDALLVQLRERREPQ